MSLKKSGTVFFNDKSNYKFDTAKASKEFHMAYDLVRAVRDAGFLDIVFTMNWDMLRKVTPEGVVPILHLGAEMHNADTQYCIGLDADAKTGEHLTIVHDKKNRAYRLSLTDGVLGKPVLLMVKQQDMTSCLSELTTELKKLHSK